MKFAGQLKQERNHPTTLPPYHPKTKMNINEYHTNAAEIDDGANEQYFIPNNRPYDGRVCDCEDAPCCGHYEL